MRRGRKEKNFYEVKIFVSIEKIASKTAFKVSSLNSKLSFFFIFLKRFVTVFESDKDKLGFLSKLRGCTPSDS